MFSEGIISNLCVYISIIYLGVYSLAPNKTSGGLYHKVTTSALKNIKNYLIDGLSTFKTRVHDINLLSLKRL